MEGRALAARIYPLGESALVLASGAPATIDVQRRIWRVAEEARAWPGVAEAVAGMNNLTLLLDAEHEPEALAARFEAAWASAPPAAPGTKVVEIPVRYGGDAGPDLDDVARRCGLAPAEVARLHCAREYEVYFLGFQPGFAYLGDLDERIRLPRRADPRAAVPAGSVAIAGQHTGIYPARSPGGWHVIGRTAVPLFDVTREVATLLAPGDRVRFISEDAAP